MMFSTVKSELKFREDRLSSYEKRINSKVDSAETSVVTNQASEMAAYGPHECFGRCLTLFLLARDWDLHSNRKTTTKPLPNGRKRDHTTISLPLVEALPQHLCCRYLLLIPDIYISTYSMGLNKLVHIDNKCTCNGSVLNAADF